MIHLYYKSVFLLFIAILCLINVYHTVAYLTQPDPQVSQLRQLIASGQLEGPQLGLAHFQLGILLQQQWYSKQIDGIGLSDALDAYNMALKLLQVYDIRKTIEIYYHRGILLKLMGRGEESYQSFQASLQYELNHLDQAAIFYYRADTLLMMGKVKEAIRSYERSLALAPCKTERYYGYVSALKEQNTYSTEEWKGLLQKLLKIERRCNHASDSSTDANKQKEEKTNNDDDEVDEYEEYLPGYLFDTMANIADKTSKESDLYYAIYLVADKIKDRWLAWQNLVKGHQLEKKRRGGQSYDRQMSITTKNNTVAIFNQNLLKSFPDVSDKASKVPIFIIGMMRSGSTLMETMLDSHPLIWGMGEDSLFNANLTSLRDAMVAASTPGGSQDMRKVLLDYGRGTVLNMKKLVHSQQSQQATNHKASIKQNKSKQYHIVDKMLFNYRNLGFIHAVYPNAAILHMIRDPMDTLWSCFRNKFDDVGLEWTLTVEDLVLQFVLYLEYMHHFRQLLPRDRMIEIRYEDLIYNPEDYLEQVMEDQLAMPYNATMMLGFHKRQRVVQTHSQSQVRQKLYTHSIGNWRSYAEQLKPIIEEFRKYLPYLKKKKMLPFVKEINWEMRVDFPYEDQMKQAQEKEL